jgi:HEAT repeat protein
VYAAVAAARLGALEPAGQTLTPLLTHEDRAVRGDLVVQLKRIEADPATAWLIAMTDDPDKLVRAEAYRGLIGRPAQGLAEIFQRGGQDPAYEVACVALTGLASVGDRRHVAEVAALMDSDNPYVAMAAAHAVLALGANQGAAIAG